MIRWNNSKLLPFRSNIRHENETAFRDVIIKIVSWCVRIIDCSLDKQITRWWSVSETVQDSTDTSVRLLENPGLGKVNPSNYRPISNLSTSSKIGERLI